MTSRAEELFKEIVAGGSAFVRQMVSDQRPESEILDYKTGSKLQDQHIRKLWAKSLSGFGNTEGGVVLFGVDCSRLEVGGRKLDVPHGVSPHSDPPVLVQRLKDLLRDCTEHPVQGVQFKTLTETTGGGYIACFVPSGNDKPYRSSVDDVYYQRVQDGCIAMSHSLLRSLFFPRTQPRIQLSARPNSPGTGLLDYHFNIGNSGTATARGMVVGATASAPFEHLMATNDFHQPDYNPGRGTSSAVFIAKDALHPGQSRSVFIARVRMTNSDGSPKPLPSLTLDVFTEDHEAKHFVVALSFESPAVTVTEMVA